MSDIINYYQTIPALGIKGRMNTPEEFDKIGLPFELIGKSVLEIGCNIGAFLLESLGRGSDLVVGVEPDNDWRWIATGIFHETGLDQESIFYKSIDDMEKDLGDDDGFDVVLLLSITHLDEVEDPQYLIDKAWHHTTPGGLLIVEVNDRLQRKEIKLPDGANKIGYNKDNRSVYHCTKSKS